MASTRTKRQDLKLKKELTTEESMYSTGDILAIYHEDYQDKFTFAVVKNNVQNELTTITANLAVRAVLLTNIFYIIEDSEVQILHSDIIAAITDAKRDTTKPLTVKDANKLAHKVTLKITVTTKSYNITKSIASNFTPAIIQESEEEKDEDEEDINSRSKSKNSRSNSKSAKKNKKIIGSKKNTNIVEEKPKRTKKGEDSIPLIKPGKFKMTKDGKVAVEKYIKGKLNPAVTVRTKMEQKSNPSLVSKLDFSINNNSRELIRAAQIGSIKLYQTVAYSKEKIHTLNPVWGCNEHGMTPLRIALLN